MAEAAAEIGFDGVDLTVRPNGHVLPQNAEKVLPLAVEHIKKNGLKADMMTTSINDPDNEFTEKILNTAAGNGIKTYRMGYWRYEKGEEDIPAALSKFRKKNAKTGHFEQKARHQGRLSESFGIFRWRFAMGSMALTGKYQTGRNRCAI